MSNNKKRNQNPAKGTIEDAAKALKDNQEGTDSSEETTEEETTEDQLEQETSREEQPEGKIGTECDQQGSEQSKPGPTSSEETTGEVFVPTETEIKAFAQRLADNPHQLAAFRRTLTMAESIIKDQAKGPRKSPEEMAAINFQALVNTYGKDFVTAKKGTNNKYFSRKAWNGMGKNKNGWSEVTKEMPEVAAPKA